MRKSIFATAPVLALIAGLTLMPQAAQAQSPLGISHFYNDQNYCWYPAAWNGPGWYWCGYDDQDGSGWGGRAGWHHWRQPRGGIADNGRRAGHDVNVPPSTRQEAPLPIPRYAGTGFDGGHANAGMFGASRGAGRSGGAPIFPTEGVNDGGFDAHMSGEMGGHGGGHGGGGGRR